jgi:hypothetical protein
MITLSMGSIMESLAAPLGVIIVSVLLCIYLESKEREAMSMIVKLGALAWLIFGFLFPAFDQLSYRFSYGLLNVR